MMRSLLTVTVDTERGNEAIRNHQIEKIIEQLSERIQPESSWFTAVGGHRVAYFVFDLLNSNQLPVIAEPLFQQLGARVEITPVMNLLDLREGLAQLPQ
jgi:hypothetical protein